MQLLTRLNAKAGISEGFGGIPELTTSDICAALAGANKAGLELLIGQVCGVVNYKDLYDLYLPETMRIAKRLKWRSDKPTTVRIHRLLDITLSESLASRKCLSCHGTKFSYLNPSKKCESCSGTGLFNNFDYLKAKYLLISDRAWRKTWRSREKDIQALFDRRIHQAKRKIIINLYGEPDS